MDNTINLAGPKTTQESKHLSEGSLQVELTQMERHALNVGGAILQAGSWTKSRAPTVDVLASWLQMLCDQLSHIPAACFPHYNEQYSQSQAKRNLSFLKLLFGHRNTKKQLI